MEINRTMRSMGDLVLGVVRLRWDRGLGEQNKTVISLAATRAGLLDQDKQPTPKYFALMSDGAEQFARVLTGQSKLCVCGFGKKAKIGEYAFKRCRFKALVGRASRRRVA